MMSKITKFKWATIGLIAFLAVGAWVAVWHEQSAGILTISFLDVGQGDAIFIDSPTHRQVLLDGGPPGKIGAPLSAVMPWYDRSIDLVIMSHPDADHIGGLPATLDRYGVSQFMEPGVLGDTGVYRELENKIKVKHIPVVLARRGQVINIGGGATLQILFPDRDVTDWETNDASIVAKLIYGSTTVMLTGDSPQKIEKYLVGLDSVRLRSNVLKLGHHGSKTSSSEEYLKAVMPELAIISAGLNNRYGHPHQEVLDRLAGLRVPVLRTEDFDHQKTITLVSDGKKFIER